MQLVDQLKNHFARMPSGKRKMIIYSALIAILAAGMFYAYDIRESDSKKVQQKADEKRKAFDLPNPDMAKDSWVEKGQRMLQQQERKIAEMNQALKSMQDRLERIQAGDKAGGETGRTSSPGSAAEREEQLMQDLRRMGVSTVERGGELYPPNPVAPAVPSETTKPLTPAPEKPFQIQDKPPVVPSAPPPTKPGTPPAQSVQPPRTAAPEPPKTVMGVYNFSQAPTNVETIQAAATTGSGETMENFYTPTGSFFKVSLLSGVDAPAGPTSSNMPHPVLLRVQDLSFLPNEVRQNVTGCFVLTEAYGDLSTERAYLRGTNLSCVNKENRFVLDEEVHGFVSDSDGKIGLRGNVVSKRGQFLSRALFATFIQAVGQGFENAGSTTVVTTGGNVTASDSQNFNDGFKSGLGAGLNETAEKLGDFYMKNAERLYPIIEIGATRSATFTISTGKRFQFNKVIIEGEGQKEKKIDGQL